MRFNQARKNITKFDIKKLLEGVQQARRIRRKLIEKGCQMWLVRCLVQSLQVKVDRLDVALQGCDFGGCFFESDILFVMINGQRSVVKS